MVGRPKWWAAHTPRGPHPLNIAVILLAAGASVRLGQPKQLLPYQGKSLLRHAAQTACDAHCGEVFVVLGAYSKFLEPELVSLPVRVIYAEDWPEGMAASLRAGIHAIANCDAVLVMLCDQPLVTKEHLQALLAEFQLGVIVASNYGEAIGPPCVFDRAYFPELLALTGDSGARGLLKKHPCRTVAFPGGRVDVDTLTDWQALAAPTPPG
ncbi:NTP transferase domain-containing protein [Armatimonas sp.]|uniref:nucleotidyltransferase family protein n=1 Tax=Armatimonas sp. TaxID=1872638 RepID=UPI00375065BE